MNKVYRAAMVGTGSIGEAHVNAVEATQGRVTLEAAVDLEQERVAAFAQRHGIPGVFTDHAQMLREVKPDIVLVATPPAEHAKLSVAAMEAGAWVLCEKPLCASLRELDEIQAAEQRTGRYTACIFQMRFASSSAHVRRLVASGQLGRVLVGVCNTLWFRDPAYYAVPWRGRWETDFGGPTTALGIHAMDHFLHLMGDWSEVRAMAGTLDRAIEVEDISMALVRFKNGAFGSIVNSALSPRQETYIRLDYQRATLELKHLYGYTRDNWTFTPVPPVENDSLVQTWQSFPPDVGSTHGAQLNAFIADMDANRRPLTSGEESRKTLELITAIYKSAYSGEIVTRGSITPGDPFYDAFHGNLAPKRVKGQPPELAGRP